MIKKVNSISNEMQIGGTAHKEAEGNVNSAFTDLRNYYKTNYSI